MINVTEYNVKPDAITLNTESLQQLIDKCAEAGGGTLVFPPGKYLTGSLVLRSNIHIHIEAGAEILGSTSLADYKLYDIPPVRFSEDQEGLRALFFAHQVNNITLSGSGTINGQGSLLEQPKGMRASLPRNIWFAESEDVKVEGLTLRCSGFWMQHYLKCIRLRLQNLKVYNHGSSNNDGCDIDCCQDVFVSNCNIDSHDDALCLKSGNDRPTENVVISNCITRTHCNHFKTGTESNGGFRNITVNNWQMVPSTVRKSDPHTGGADWRGACGIALGCVDGGMLENISINNVQMDQVRVPFFIKLGDRGIPIHGSEIHQPVQYAKGIRLTNISSKNASSTGGYIMGLPEAPVCAIRIENCDFEFEGGGDDKLAESTIPLNHDCYPSCDAFGALPSYGIFMRDVEDIQLLNLSFQTLQPESRPALRWQRVNGLQIHNIKEQLIKKIVFENNLPG